MESPFLEPIGEISIPAGYAASSLSFGDNPRYDRASLSRLAARVLEDPLMLQQLSDRVYDLMREDLLRQRERGRNYGK